MKTILLYITIILFTLSCQSNDYAEGLDRLMTDKKLSTEEAIQIIDGVVNTVNTFEVDTVKRKEYANRVNFEYLIFSKNGRPIKVSSILNENTYTVNSTYYIHNQRPYYIEGYMRDRDRASGNYTHKEMQTYLDGKRVLRRLQKTGINQENRPSDLSQFPQEDITHTIYSPELDGEDRYKEVMKILGNPID